MGSSTYSTSGVYYGAQNATSSKPIPMSVASSVSGANDSVHLTVSVPSQARVFVNDNLTTSTGAVRQFVSKGLTPGKSYRFMVRAEVDAADGTKMTDEKEVVVSAGQFEQLQFAFENSRQPIQTAVTLNVPEDAEVTLAGNQTKISGQSRVFRTSQLLVGDVWDDYEIEVKQGDQVKRQKIRLIAGDNIELTFNFDEETDRLASR
ncbi:MAG: TIGR03000 domain-containing protein [Planctomycetales bacterium]|nr:TIGR03000 domain-containing protein [Planctomycetales bacterium]